jgi:hypothetical protein
MILDPFAFVSFSDNEMCVLICFTSSCFFLSYTFFQNPILFFVVPPMIASCPYLLRIRQIVLFMRVCDPRDRRANMLNLAKYASNFPAIWCQAVLLSMPPSTTFGIGLSKSLLIGWEMDRVLMENVVLGLGFTSGILSFLWDVHMDWGLSTCFGTTPWLRQSGSDSRASDVEQPSEVCLREVLLFRCVGFYRVAVVANLLARLSGALLGLSEVPRLASLRGVDLSLLLQVLEVARRSMWVALRVEWECIKTNEMGGYSLSRKV